MILDLLPTRTAGAAENMAADFLLLQRYPESTHARFRHYDWRGPAFTFGYSQKIAYVRAQLATLAPDEHLDLTRRPTGGGVVDHRDDWTFALVIPRGHALYDARATESYRQIHADLTAALRDQGQPVILKERCEPAAEGAACEPGPTVCFTRPELYDVIHADTGAKVAGAAQKRTKHGLLFQGSIAKTVLAPTMDWDAFEEAFTARLATTLGAEAVPTPWPEFAEGEHDGLTEQYTSTEWIEYR
ncbi:lipoate--protein ligase family protein [Rariglobus hedericola]|uniref:Lipoate--protein ligase family protein n=1 Tax=Rariglobus hedericola TaxID=2597822 RepID=A0A556QGV3_9BACT|nr:lipoate--protein ligase family protein [Rariglobus hedericola]TSJ75860.1 lipoate--protein ligase family protein [Rariglobus hedericola]